MAGFSRVSPKGAEGPAAGIARRARRSASGAGTWLALAIVSAAVVIIVSPGFLARTSTVNPGDVWVVQDLYSPFALTITDSEADKDARTRIEQRHDKVFRYDSDVERRAIGKLVQLFDLAAGAHDGRRSGETTATDLQKRARAELDLNLKYDTAETIADNWRNDRFRTNLATVIHNVQALNGVTADKSWFTSAWASGRLVVVAAPGSDEPITTFTAENVLAYPGEIAGFLNNRYLPQFNLQPEMARVYSDIAVQLIAPNLIYDPPLTRVRMDMQLDAVNNQVRVQRGSRIIARGDRVTHLQASILDALGSKIRHYNFLKAFGSVVFVSLAILFLAVCARRFNPQLSFKAGDVFMVALPLIFALAVGRTVLNLATGGHAAVYAFPAGMLGMLAVILFEARFAMLLVTFGSVLFGLAAGLDYPCVLVGIVGGFTAVAGLYSIRERREVLLAGLRVSLVNAVTILAVGFAERPDTLDLAGALGGILNGLVCYVLTLGALPVIESLFGVATDVRLIELTSTNHPLLDMMEEKAPGSYQHSLNVAKLAEPAADAIGANFLLVRAGAQFHDIGKMVKPKYYGENQVTADERRIHARLSPYMSNLIIKNHVKDGIELARRYRLPQKVVDFIPQHQGTGLVKYFYSQALKKAEADDIVVEDEFRYPGPKPQTIEAAIVMLADAVEATATAKFSDRGVREDDLRKVVRDSVLEKFNDNQFDECHMTFRDLHQIRESFVRTLLGRFHHRLDYPSLPRRDNREPARPEPVPASAQR